MKKVLLTDEHFADLVKGKVIEVNGVKICLQDIGFHRMIEHINTAANA